MRKFIRRRSQKQWLAANKASYEFQLPPTEDADDARPRQKTGQEIPNNAQDAEGNENCKD